MTLLYKHHLSICPGDLSYGIDVTLNFSGEASPEDCSVSGSSIVSQNANSVIVRIPAWQESVAVTVQAFDDAIVERLYETLDVTIVSAKLPGNPNVSYAFAAYDPNPSDPNYKPPPGSILNFKIEDNDTLTLEKVTFFGDLGMIADPGLPVWHANGYNSHWYKDHPELTVPVAYANGDNKIKTDTWFTLPVNGSVDSSVTLEVRFVASGFPGGDVKSEWTSVDSYLMAYDVTALQSLLAIYGTLQPDYIEEMVMWWELRVNGDDNDIRNVNGVSVNPFYVTRTQPSGTLYHTVVHTGCKAAKGWTADQFVFNAIWDKFEDLEIHSVKVANGAVVDNELLSYYGKRSDDENGEVKKKLHIEATLNGSVATPLPPTQFPTIAREFTNLVNNVPMDPSTSTACTGGLLLKFDGTCDAWADFMVNVLGVQGGVSNSIGIITNQNVANPIHNYLFPVYAFKVKENTEGQGTTSPDESIWGGHTVVEYDGKIYDPSYGLSYGIKSDAREEFLKQSVESVGDVHAAPGGSVDGYGRVYVAHAGPLLLANLYFEWG